MATKTITWDSTLPSNPKYIVITPDSESPVNGFVKISDLTPSYNDLTSLTITALADGNNEIITPIINSCENSEYKTFNGFIAEASINNSTVIWIAEQAGAEYITNYNVTNPNVVAARAEEAGFYVAMDWVDIGATFTFSWNETSDTGTGKGLFDFSGAIAPALPAYNSTTYPCATIIMNGTYNDQPRYYLCLHNGYNHAGTHVVGFTEPMIAYSYVRGSEAWVSQEVNKSSFDTMGLIWSNTSYMNTDEYGNTVDITAESPTSLDSYNLLFGPTPVPSDVDTFQYGNYTMYKVSEELLPTGISHAIIAIVGLVVDSFTMPATVIGNSQAFTEGEIALVISVDEDDLSTFGAPSQGLYFMDASFYHINCCAYKVESTSDGYFPVPEVYVPYVNTAKKLYEQYFGLDVDYGKIAVAENENYISVHFLQDNFALVAYDADTTIYTATGIAFVTYDKRTDKWDATPVDNTTTTSEGSRYISHWVWSEVDVTWEGATVFTNQEGWYYNSVKLPDINDTLDKSEHPYSVISADTIPEIPGATIGILVTSSTSMYYDHNNGSDMCFRFVEDGHSIMYSGGTGMSDMGSPDGWCAVHNPPGDSHESGDSVIYLNDPGTIWSSHDIFDTEGNLYLSASEPVHVTYVVEEDSDDPNDPDDPDKSSYDELSFKIGLVFGLCGKGIPKGLLLFDGDDYMLNWYSKDGFIETVELDGKYWGKISNTVPLLDGNTLLEIFVDGNILISESGIFTEIEDNWYRHATTLVYVATGTNSKNLSTGIWYLSDNNIPTEGYHIRMSKE